MSTMRTTVTELQTAGATAQQNAVNSVLAQSDQISKKLIALQRVQGQLRASQQMVIQQMRRDLTLLETGPEQSDFYKTIDSVPSYNTADLDPSHPDPRINYARNKLELEIADLQARNDRIGAQLKSVAIQITDAQRDQQNLQEKLNSKDHPITQDEIETERISTRTVTETMMLLELATAYASYRQDANGKVQYSSDPKVVGVLQKLQAQFGSFARRDDWYTSGALILDLNDPGSDSNIAHLQAIINPLRATQNNIKTISDQVHTYAQNMSSLVTDPNTGKNASRRLVQENPPTPNNSFTGATQTMATFCGFTDTTGVAFTWAKAVDSFLDNFKRGFSATNGDKPYCGENTAPTTQAQMQLAQSVAATQATAIYQSSLAKSVSVSSKPPSALILSLDVFLGNVSLYPNTADVLTNDVDVSLFTAASAVVLAQVPSFKNTQPISVARQTASSANDALNKALSAVSLLAKDYNPAGSTIVSGQFSIVNGGDGSIAYVWAVAT